MSSIRITITFGLPGFARGGAIQCGVDSASVLPMWPSNWEAVPAWFSDMSSFLVLSNFLRANY